MRNESEVTDGLAINIEAHLRRKRGGRWNAKCVCDGCTGVWLRRWGDGSEPKLNGGGGDHARVNDKKVDITRAMDL